MQRLSDKRALVEQAGVHCGVLRRDRSGRDLTGIWKRSKRGMEMRWEGSGRDLRRGSGRI